FWGDRQWQDQLLYAPICGTNLFVSRGVRGPSGQRTRSRSERGLLPQGPRILERAGRGNDYVEVSLDSEYRYNPLNNDLEAYTLAYGIASLLNNLFGKGKEPFWQQAYTNLVKFIIILHQVGFGYVTLFDVYECAINHGLLAEKIRDGEERMSTHYLLVNTDTYLAHEDLDRFTWERDDAAHCMKAERSDTLEAYLTER